MIFRQVIHEDLGCASYLIGDEHVGVAAVVDPRYEIEEYLELASRMGVRIEHVFETHTHADHLSGHGRLSLATGARIHIHRDANAAYAHEPFDDGEEFQLGALSIRALHTPGHRPEHTAFLLADVSRGGEPWAVLTGDSLFVGGIARPDLAVEMEEGARGIFRSLTESLLSLPDEVELWPGHLGGSMCGGPGMSMKICSTIGFERHHNPMLAAAEEQFVRETLAALGPQPPNFKAIVELNRGELIGEEATPPALSPRQLERKLDDGALLIDTRTDRQFDDGHIPGAISITLSHAGFATKLAWLAKPGQEIVFVGDEDGDGRRAGLLALAVGLRELGGFLHGGMGRWDEEQRPVERVERVAIEQLSARAEAEPELQILDVRERGEWDAGHIPGSSFLAWHDIEGAVDGLDLIHPIAVVCGSGQRAATAASLLQRHGAQRPIHVVAGGVPEWGRLGHPLESAPASDSVAS